MRIYKEHSKLNTKKKKKKTPTNNQVRNGQKINRHFTKKDMSTADKHMIKCLTLAIQEM